ncbi:MAG: TetR/AcrR family transcriptional regulator [Reyranellales bacterium]
MNQRPNVPATGASGRNSPRVDGRRLRSERTRQSIVEAYLALLRENPKIPTANRIAERAGYSVRSIFERFPDLHELRVAATDHAFVVGNTQAEPRHVNGDRQARLRSQVETRAQTCEQWLPLWRALNMNQGDSAALKLRIKVAREMVRARLELMYKSELSTLAEPERRRTVIALELLTDFESWGRMRELYGLSVEDACTVWIRAIDGMLPPTPPAK